MTSNVNAQLKKISSRFVEERLRLNWSQRNLAHVLNVSREGLRKNETAITEMKVSTLSAVATLGFDTQYILTGIKSKNAQEIENFFLNEVSHD